MTRVDRWQLRTQRPCVLLMSHFRKVSSKPKGSRPNIWSPTSVRWKENIIFKMHILDLCISTTYTLDQVKINVWSTSLGRNFKKHGWKLQRTLQIWFSQHVPSKLSQCIMYVGEGQDQRSFLGLKAQKWGRPSMQVEAPLPYGWKQLWTCSSPYT